MRIIGIIYMNEEIQNIFNALTSYPGIIKYDNEFFDIMTNYIYYKNTNKELSVEDYKSYYRKAFYNKLNNKEYPLKEYSYYYDYPLSFCYKIIKSYILDKLHSNLLKYEDMSCLLEKNPFFKKGIVCDKIINISYKPGYTDIAEYISELYKINYNDLIENINLKIYNNLEKLYTQILTYINYNDINYRVYSIENKKNMLILIDMNDITTYRYREYLDYVRKKWILKDSRYLIVYGWKIQF